MKIAILYEDNKIFVQFTQEEFLTSLEKYLDQGKTPREAIKLIVKDLKQKTLTA